MALYPSIGTLPPSSTLLDSQRAADPALAIPTDMDEWVSKELPFHYRRFTRKRELSVSLMTFNVGCMLPNGEEFGKIIQQELIPFPKEDEDVAGDGVSDMIVIALQEVDMSRIAIIREQTNAAEQWTQAVLSFLNTGSLIPEQEVVGSTLPSTNDADVPTGRQSPAYTLVASRQLVGILLIVCAHTHTVLPHMSEVHIQTVGTGAFGTMGNKGAVGIRMRLFGTTSLCILNMHLSAHMGRFERRNRDAGKILSTFGRQDMLTQSSPSSSLLQFPSLLPTEHDHCLVLGDLNYRVQVPYKVALDHIETNNMKPFIHKDQLVEEMRKNRPPWRGFNEGPITFLPTYRFDMGSLFQYDTSAKLRVPAFTDRVLWHSREEQSHQPRLLRYTSLMHVVSSDHKPIVAAFRIPVRVLDNQKMDHVRSQLTRMGTEHGLERVCVPRLHVYVDEDRHQQAQEDPPATATASNGSSRAIDNCLNPSIIDFGVVSALDELWSAHVLRLYNPGHCVVLVRVRRLQLPPVFEKGSNRNTPPGNSLIGDDGSWIRAQPEAIQILPGEVGEIRLEAVVDRFTSHQLLSNAKPFQGEPHADLHVVLGLEMKGGGVRFLECRAKLKWTLLGLPLQTLLDCREYSCEDAFASKQPEEHPRRVYNSGTHRIESAAEVFGTTQLRMEPMAMRAEASSSSPANFIPLILWRLCHSFVVAQRNLSAQERRGDRNDNDSPLYFTGDLAEVFLTVWDPTMTPLVLQDDVLKMLTRLSQDSPTSTNKCLHLLPNDEEEEEVNEQETHSLITTLGIIRAALLHWLQELPEPIIPASYIPAALALGEDAVSSGNVPPPAALCAFLEEISVSNRNALFYILSFLRYLLRCAPLLTPQVLADQFTGVLFGTPYGTPAVAVCGSPGGAHTSPESHWLSMQLVLASASSKKNKKKKKKKGNLSKQRTFENETSPHSDTTEAMRTPVSSSSHGHHTLPIRESSSHHYIPSAWRKHNERFNRQMNALTVLLLALLGDEWLE